jgi:hypothetical protein
MSGERVLAAAVGAMDGSTVAAVRQDAGMTGIVEFGSAIAGLT